MSADKPVLYERILRVASELFALVVRAREPEQRVTTAFLRSKKRLSAEERRAASSLAYSALRMKLLIDAMLSDGQPFGEIASAISLKHAARLSGFRHVLHEVPVSAPIALHSRTACLDSPTGQIFEGSSICLHNAIAKLTGLSADEVATAMADMQRWFDAIADTVRTSDESSSFLAAQYALQPWWLDAWRTSGLDAAKCGEALLRPPPVWLRVNAATHTVEAVMNGLTAAGHSVTSIPNVPFALQLVERSRVDDTPLYRDGAFEIQDISTQFAALAMAPHSGWRILDACAGAGGKSMHFASLQKDRGTILACDSATPRLRSLQQRAARAGFQSIATISEKKLKSTPHLEGTFDAVLVDAPCSSSGVSRRMPSVKWKLTEDTVHRLAGKQLEILESYAPYVAENGYLSYTTCSLLPMENEAVVSAFLERHPEFIPAPFLSDLHLSLPDLTEDMWHYTITPDVFDSDGFFLSRMKRISK
ncbi:MAG: hypothetical protein CL946_10275 [Ectothiorhodospiraceae bacterium]|nr:hypothetical protein [Ectothiorhodospiraceae bacterium]